MVAIGDKFGKASKSSDYASATTVKTARIAGVTVLETFDLSKYPTDTPLFFITYKKTIDPVTNVVSILNQVSWKGLVNDVSNTITNLTVAPGFTDLGNDVGDFVEAIPTSFWETSLIDGLLTSINPNGTLKTQAVKDALNIATASADWTPLATMPSSVVYNGQRSYEITIPGINYTDRLNPGTRLMAQRTVSAPTQSTSLNGTNQYWVKTSPNKLTFTDDFVVSAWVKLSSYTSGVIASRYNGTSGWELFLNATGQIALQGRNGGASNLSYVLSYQSIPLNKWVHITAQLDMSAFTATSTTSYIMIDGIDVPSLVSRGGSNPTSLIQAGNLEIGSENGGTLPFPGKIAQVAIFNSKVTQATMRGYISQGLTGSEPNLASAWSFNGNANDLNTTTPNNLTAQNSATATNADSPFGGQANGTISSTLDYGIVQSATFSTNTTLTVQVPEGCTIPTTGGVSAVSYSSAKVPYGFPVSEEKWKLTFVTSQDSLKTGAVAASWYGDTAITATAAGTRVIVPAGIWEFKAKMIAHAETVGTAFQSIRLAYSTSTTAPTDDSLDVFNQAGGNLNLLRPTILLDSWITVTAFTTYYLLVRTDNSTTVGVAPVSGAKNVVQLKNAYL